MVQESVEEGNSASITNVYVRRNLSRERSVYIYSKDIFSERISSSKMSIMCGWLHWITWIVFSTYSRQQWQRLDY